MANPQPDKFTKISNELYEAIIQTNFSKRQRNIIDLVIRMSYGCRKKVAILRHSDFEVVGVLRTHIKKELEYLVSVKVLFIDGEQIVINKNYDEWRVSLVKQSKEKMKEILNRNLSSETEQMVTKTVTHDNKTNVCGVTEKVTVQNDSYQNSNTVVTKTVTRELPKQEPQCPSIPCDSKDEEGSKDIIKYIIKYKIKKKTLCPDLKSGPSDLSGEEITRKSKVVYDNDSPYMKMARYFLDHILKWKPNYILRGNMQSWADEFRLIHERDQRSKEDIKAVIDWATQDSFWKGNILSPSKLRKQFDTLQARMDSHKCPPPSRAQPSPKTPDVDPAVLKIRQLREKAKNGSV